MKKTQAERAQDYFGRNSKVSKLIGTSDGFLFERNQDALTHSTTLEKKDLVVYNSNGEKADFKPEDNKSEFLKLSVKKITEALASMINVDELEGYLKEESELLDPRSTAIEAIEKRIDELTTEK